MHVQNAFSNNQTLGTVQDQLWKQAGIHRHEVDPEMLLSSLQITLWEARNILQKTIDALGVDFTVPKDFGSRADEPWNQLETVNDIIRHVRNAWAREQAVKSVRQVQGRPFPNIPEGLLILSEGEIGFVPLKRDTPESQ